MQNISSLRCSRSRPSSSMEPQIVGISTPSGTLSCARRTTSSSSRIIWFRITCSVFTGSNAIWTTLGSIDQGCTALGLSFDTVKLRIRCFTWRRPGFHTVDAMEAEAFVPERGPDIVGLKLRQFVRANRYRSQLPEIRPFQCTHESTDVVYFYGRSKS